MIDLLGEAKNYMNLYQFALSCREEEESGERTRSQEEYKQEWEELFYLDFPKTGANPELLKRALLLTAGWSLFRTGRTLQETVAFLGKWYETVMRLALKGMGDKARAPTAEFVKKCGCDYNKSENWFLHLDKINYYRIACQAQDNGDLVTPPIIVPVRIMDAWKNDKIPDNDRVLHILYHYLGERPGLTKTDIEHLFCKNSSSLKSKKLISNPPSPEGKDINFVILRVEDTFQWEDGEQGVEIPKTLRLAKQLSDGNLQSLRIRSSPDYWLFESERVASAESMMKRYHKTRPTDLSNQNARTGSKAASLRRCALALLYFASEEKTPFPWKNWEELQPNIPSGWMCPDWERIERWVRENYASVLPLIEDFESSETKSVGAFFQEMGEGTHFVRSDGNSIRFFRKD